MRSISVEPLLGRIDLGTYLGQCDPTNPHGTSASLHWVVVGGESGPFYREMRDESVPLLRAQCLGAGVAFYFKQHSGIPSEDRRRARRRPVAPVSGTVSVKEGCDPTTARAVGARQSL